MVVWNSIERENNTYRRPPLKIVPQLLYITPTKGLSNRVALFYIFLYIILYVFGMITVSKRGGGIVWKINTLA